MSIINNNLNETDLLAETWHQIHTRTPTLATYTFTILHLINIIRHVVWLRSVLRVFAAVYWSKKTLNTQYGAVLRTALIAAKPTLSYFWLLP